MPTPANRVRIQSIDWSTVFPAVRLASAFRLAIQPGKLLIALLAVLVLHFAGFALDEIWGPVETASGVITNTEDGIYESFVGQEVEAFRSIVGAAGSLDFGFYGNRSPRQVGVLGGLLNLAVYTPLGLIVQHPGFAAIYGLIALVVFTLLGGMICRMSATQVCAEQSTSVTAAGRYVLSRALWFILTPIMPLVLIGLLGLVLIIVGLVFFNVPNLDVVGAVLYGPMLVIGLFIAVISLVVFFAIHLMTPALAVEGTDGFDAVSRAMNYVLFRPWQLGFYLVLAVAYAAVVYLLIGGIAELTMGATATLVEVGVIAESEEVADVSRFEAAYREAHASLHDSSASPEPASWILGRWLDAVGLLVTAFMFSLYCCLQTLVYLLVRRSADGTPLDEFDPGESLELWSSPADVTDNAPAAQPAADNNDA